MRNTRPRAQKRFSLTPSRVWVGLFGIWALFLTGVFENFTGSPGVLQAYRLRRLLDLKAGELQKAETELTGLRHDRDALEGNGAYLEREVRRVLGYVAQDELVFEFGE